MPQRLQVRAHGDPTLPALVYLPGIHGDWTLVSSFRAAVAGRVRFIEFTYTDSATESLDDYADSIQNALAAQGVSEGWVLGESFGSQLAWRLIDRAATPDKSGGGRVNQSGSQSTTMAFRPLGLVLSGGFVRHPVIPAVRVVARISSAIPMPGIKAFCAVYRSYAKFRHRHAPETLATIDEFIAHRTTESDRQAMTHRYKLIAGNDPREVARGSTLPVYYLGGLVDPLVPWPLVRRWLRRNCPGYRGGRTFWGADHNVLGTAPIATAQQVLAWMSAEAGKGNVGATAETPGRGV